MAATERGGDGTRLLLLCMVAVGGGFCCGTWWQRDVGGCWCARWWWERGFSYSCVYASLNLLDINLLLVLTLTMYILP